MPTWRPPLPVVAQHLGPPTRRSSAHPGRSAGRTATQISDTDGLNPLTFPRRAVGQSLTLAGPYSPVDAERLLRMDLQNWTIRVLSPTALRGVGLHYWADPMTVLPAWQPRREGEQPGPHLQVCKAAYFAADARNNTEWQTRTLGTRSDGGTTDEHRRQRPPSATSQVHQLADQLGPDYFTTSASARTGSPATGRTTVFPPGLRSTPTPPPRWPARSPTAAEATCTCPTPSPTPPTACSKPDCRPPASQQIPARTTRNSLFPSAFHPTDN